MLFRKKHNLIVAISTINKMKKFNLSDYLNKIGKLIEDGWRILVNKYDLDVLILHPNAIIIAARLRNR
ncbi:MAG: hypothetical protein ACFFDH_05490, partial [Promethearchaeota archaeon]